MQSTPSASYSLTLRVRLPNRPGTLGEVTTAIGRVGGDIGAIDIVQVVRDAIVRDITVNAASTDHEAEIVRTVRSVPGVEVVNVSDRTFLMHLGGKIEVRSKQPLRRAPTSRWLTRPASPASAKRFTKTPKRRTP
jgi:malate dehydrogenase (oxaloacetate-decarboxylating)